MKPIALVVLLLVVLAPSRGNAQSSAGPRSAARASAAPITADNPWMREGQAGRSSGGYALIRNQGPQALTIVGIRSDVAEAVELHEMTHTNSMMQMRRVQEAVVPPQGQLALAPGGLHLMFIGLTRKISVGDSVRVTLMLAGGGKKDIVFSVRKLDAD